MMKYIKVLYAISLLVFIASGLSYAQTNATLLALNPQEGDNSVYQLRFNPIDTLSENAIIIIILPTQFDNSETRIAGSSSINGGFEVETRGDSIFISRSGLGRAILPGEMIELNVALIKNPEDLTATYSATIIVIPGFNAIIRRLFTVTVAFT